MKETTILVIPILVLAALLISPSVVATAASSDDYQSGYHIETREGQNLSGSY